MPTSDTLSRDILRSAEDKKFTEFSNAVKQRMQNKLANNTDIKDYTDEYDKIQGMKAAFAKINTDFSKTEPEEVQNTKPDAVDEIDPKENVDNINPNEE